ncbi:MAG: carboxypeptidase regulatory-like domain-containing protein [Planctomycetes bacterium]|nr:carboxypeptidase regulatory-like domain-containing protein [Planctomycetota bacterium]
MKSRGGLVITVLAGLVLLALVAGYFLLSGPANRTTSRPGETATRAPGEFDDNDPELVRARKAASQAAAAGNPCAGGADGTTATQPEDEAPPDPKQAKPGELGEVPEVDPEEINAPVPGHLIIRVLDRTDERTLPGSDVYYPIRGAALEVEGGDVKIHAGLSPLRKKTNKHGVAVWSQKELTKLLAEPLPEGQPDVTSVLVTALGYADLFEPQKVPDLTKGGELKLKLFSAVRVTGKVREKRGGAVSFISVDVLQTSSQGDGGGKPLNRFTVRADGLGEFALKVADAYTYRFEVKAPGFAPYTSQDFDFRRDEREVSVLLEPARGISGVVLGQQSKPLAGAKVHAVNDLQSVLTDDKGKFVFDMVRDRIFTNDVLLRFSAEGYAPENRVVLANDRNVRVQLKVEGTLRGTVLDDKKKPIAGATVNCAYIEGADRYPRDPVYTNEKGEFVFRGFADGQVQLSAAWEGLASETEVVDVKAGREVKARLTLYTAAAITGRVHSGGTGIAKVTISLDGKSAAATDGEGNFTLSGVRGGEHTVRVVNQFPIPDEQLRQLPIFTADGKAYYYLPVERKLEVKPGAGQSVDFEVQPFDTRVDRKITVRIVTVPQETTKGLQVTIRPVLGTPPQGIEAPKTQVIALDLPDGTADLPLSLLNGVSYEATFVHNRYFTATLTPQAFADVPDGGKVEVRLERAFIIKGYVKDSLGAGIESVGLSNDRNNPWKLAVQTDIHGYFEFGQLKEGKYLVTAFKTSYYQEQREVEINGTDPEPLQLVLVSANEIRIRVVNNGSPQPGAHVHIYRNRTDGENPDDVKEHFDIGTTDANGEKYINFHWLRNYQIVVNHGERVGFANFNNQREVPEREFTIELEAALPLSGTVVDADTGEPLEGVVVRAHLAPSGNPLRDGNFFQLETAAGGAFSFQVPLGQHYFYVPQTRSHRSLDTSAGPVASGTSGHVLAPTIREDISGNYAQMLAITAPSSMEAGGKYEVEVTVRNMGDTTWTSAGSKPWRLGSRAPQDNTTWGFGRVPLPEGIEVRPHETWTFKFTVTAPAQPGNYAMQWQMVQDGKEWFGQLSRQLAIVVQPASGG